MQHRDIEFWIDRKRNQTETLNDFQRDLKTTENL